MSKITFSSIGNVATGNTLQVEEDGYYKLIAGGLNVFNSGGSFYIYNKNVGKLFSPESMLLTRTKRGGLYAELGHPQPQPGQANAAYVRRILRISDDNICLHIKAIQLETLNTKEAGASGNTVRVWVWAKPFGVHKEVAKDSLDNPNINTCLSIRALSVDGFKNGVHVKELTNIVTWDLVTLPGIKQASKFTAIGLESIDMVTLDMDDTEEVNELKEVLQVHEGISTEDDDGVLESVLYTIDSMCDNGRCILKDW